MSRPARTVSESYDAVDITYRPESADWSENTKPATVAQALDDLSVRVAGTKGDTGATGAAGADGSASAYTPANAGLWAGTAPDTIAKALNRIAYVLGTVTPIPELPV